LASPGGSPVAREVAELLDKYYLDRKFNGVDLKAEVARLSALELSDEEALDESTKLVKSMGDKYSRVVRPAQVAKLNKYDVTGVGINFVLNDANAVTVGAVPPKDSDAGRLGVGFGDIITSINGKSTVGMTSFDCLEAVQSKDDVATMTLRSATNGEEREVTLRRAQGSATRNPVTYHLVEAQGAKVGYIRLAEFNDQCKQRVSEAVSELEREGASRLVLDLRHNTGGALDGAVGIAGFFMDRPLVLYVTDAFGQLQPIQSREASQAKDVPIQVWVDNLTASAGEVLAGALRDNCRAPVVGTTTFGKGVIQGVFGLSDGGALVQTVGSYTTPAGQEINLKGVTPTNERIFVSDVLGSICGTSTKRLCGKFVDTDVEALAADADFRPARSCVVPPMPRVQAEESAAPIVSQDQAMDAVTGAPTTKSA
jgi:carboxyl-terminal processing protease